MTITYKRWGQHFLRDAAIIDQIVAVLSPRASDTLLEIGPGEGALTFPVLKIAGKLHAVEIDKRLIAHLQEKAKPLGNLMIHTGDALFYDPTPLQAGVHGLRIFGNLPYNISTPLLFRFLSFSHHIKDMLFMLQKEVAERMIAKPSTREYGRLSIMIQYHCQAQSLFDVERNAFHIPPKVNSSIVRLIPHPNKPYQAQDEKLFASLVKYGFNQRRKTIQNSLHPLIHKEQWGNIPFSPSLRAENLSVADFVTLSNILRKL